MSEFKVGDWVFYRSDIAKVIEIQEECVIFESNSNRIQAGFNYMYFERDIKKWQPAEGEWCWFYNSDNYDSVQLTLGKFYGTSSKELKYTYIDIDRQEYSSECCEPFIPGKFPSIIKEKQ